jgi:signal transduction histidine kinase
VRKSGWIAIGSAIALGIFWFLSTVVFPWGGSGIIDGLTTLLPVPVAFACGYFAPWQPGLGVCGGLVVIGELTGFNPFVIVITIGPWFGGVVVRDRRTVTARLGEVGRALEVESKLLANEAVLLERARIARELHDIVAHCVTVMVVQAYAGERLVGSNRQSAREAFGHIELAAEQAQHEIAHLVTLLDSEPNGVTIGALSDALENMVDGAKAAGLRVTLRLGGCPDDVGSNSAAVVYRVVQEGVTNALKHSPGGSVTIVVQCQAEITVDILNDSVPGADSSLRSAGGGHGLSGIRERVAGLGGEFAAGPEPNGSWRVSVRLPA